MKWLRSAESAAALVAALIVAALFAVLIAGVFSRYGLGHPLAWKEVYVGRRLQELGMYWLEDPLPPEDVDGYVHLAAALDMAVALSKSSCVCAASMSSLAAESMLTICRMSA